MTLGDLTVGQMVGFLGLLKTICVISYELHWPRLVYVTLCMCASCAAEWILDRMLGSSTHFQSDII